MEKKATRQQNGQQIMEQFEQEKAKYDFYTHCHNCLLALVAQTSFFSNSPYGNTRFFGKCFNKSEIKKRYRATETGSTEQEKMLLRIRKIHQMGIKVIYSLNALRSMEYQTLVQASNWSIITFAAVPSCFFVISTYWSILNDAFILNPVDRHTAFIMASNSNDKWISYSQQKQYVAVIVVTTTKKSTADIDTNDNHNKCSQESSDLNDNLETASKILRLKIFLRNVHVHMQNNPRSEECFGGMMQFMKCESLNFNAIEVNFTEFSNIQ